MDAWPARPRATRPDFHYIYTCLATRASCICMHASRAPAARLSACAVPQGHGYFVQGAHRRLQLAPFCVHATYSLDRHDSLAKEQRFREAGLWAADSPDYFRGKFLSLRWSEPPSVTALIAHSAEGASGGRPAGRTASTSRPMAHAAHNIGTHRAAMSTYVSELRDALALARALGRTLILPRWRCYCDRLWAGSDNILAMGCMCAYTPRASRAHVCSLQARLRSAHAEVACLSPASICAFASRGVHGDSGGTRPSSSVCRAYVGMPL